MRPAVSSSVRYRGRSAFSLIEVVLAVGIISFALVGILGLFPVALNSAAESQRETQAALIARSIFSDLDSETGSPRHLQGHDDSSKSDSPPSNLAGFPINVTIPTSSGGEKYLVYDSDGHLQKESNAGEYNSGDHDGAYLAKISVSAPPAGSSTPSTLYELRLTITVPASVQLNARKSYEFVSLVSK